MKSARTSAALTCAALAVLPIGASAQSRRTSDPRAGTVEIAATALWIRGYDAGNASALETRNPPTAAPLTLFTVDSQLRAASGIEARVGVYLTRRLSLEGLFTFSRPVLRSQLSGDFESAASTEADATVTSYLVGGSVAYHVGTGRLRPFVEGGAGYLRQLLEDNDGLVTGSELHAGGGMQYRLTNGAHPLGVRIGGVASVRSRSAGFEPKRRVVPAFSAGLTWRPF